MARESLKICGLEGLPEIFIHELKGLDKKQLEQLRASLQRYEISTTLTIYLSTALTFV